MSTAKNKIHTISDIEVEALLQTFFLLKLYGFEKADHLKGNLVTQKSPGSGCSKAGLRYPADKC